MHVRKNYIRWIFLIFIQMFLFLVQNLKYLIFILFWMIGCGSKDIRTFFRECRILNRILLLWSNFRWLANNCIETQGALHCPSLFSVLKCICGKEWFRRESLWSKSWFRFWEAMLFDCFYSCSRFSNSPMRSEIPFYSRIRRSCRRIMDK